MDWEEAIQEARKELGHSPYGYVSDWDEVVEKAKEILEYEREEEYQEFCAMAQEEHEKYLKSERWLELRQKILLRDNFNCVDCGKKATEVHHLNYDYLRTPEEEKILCKYLCFLP